jgi:Flp pilus assembly pilin Flp
MHAATPPNSNSCLLRRLCQEDDGQDLVEYALVALVMGLSTVAGVHGVAASVTSDFSFIVSGFNNAII